ncbi:Adenosine deaminase-related growth factor-like protein [Operophtera brumata]|uniref:Adenosine deaminase-related growth factor-like protein n=1 Tax=Operophtera brumata TaxID=104452 RepID=A0A0L7L9I3_OPEBR|nr:Adenosine deaminase-related growth factor-like protein [Operophtera brumata]
MSQHFFNYKDKIKCTELFKLLQQMPKGALLHAHSKGILSSDYVLELTYMDDLYVCFGNKSIQFKYAKKTPTNHCKIQWLLMKDTRYSSRFGTKELKKKLPDFFAGFDLGVQEDVGMPIKEFLPKFLEAGKDLDYFFHAGETNWYGTSSDENLLDAVVLNSKRIGNAFALVKHPLLLEEVKKRKIANYRN